jgi:hypothetical protein
VFVRFSCASSARLISRGSFISRPLLAGALLSTTLFELEQP